MTKQSPLGKKESLTLEFKSKEALKKPETIAREVVAMLNAKGGEVWVGLRDEGDRAVAVEPVQDAERERRRLRDYLVDTIEPSPASEEVAVEVVPAEGDDEILRVDIRPRKERGPYAHLREGGRFFLVRIDDRTRPMAREEIFVRPAGSSGRDEERALSHLREERSRIERGESLFWMGFEPIPKVEIDIQDPRLESYLTRPAETGNRQMGWSFRFISSPTVEPDALVTGSAEAKSMEIRREGGLRFKLPLKHLYWKGEHSDLWPFALVEYPVSAFRIARKIYEGKLRSEDQILVDMAFIGLRGWKLRPGSPSPWWHEEEAREFTASKDLLWESPRSFSFAEIEDEPDRCGYRFIQRIYEAFGFGRDAIPQEFDRQTGRLILPE